MSANFSAYLSVVTNQVASLSERVDNAEWAPRAEPEQQSRPSSRAETPASQTTPLWCDRPLDKPLPTGPIVWPDDKEDVETGSDEADGCQLHRVSPTTEASLVEMFSAPASNATRRRWRKAYGMPATDCTKYPKLDNTLKTQVPKEGKDADPDAVGPLASILEMQQAGRLTPETAAEAATQALWFIGNAHSNISAERRKRVITNFNKDLRPLVEESERFSRAAPLLFGKEFEKEAKEHIDSVRSIRKLGSAPSRGQRQQFFRHSCPHTYSQAACGGGAFRGGSRGRGRGRYHPYQTGKENHQPGRQNGNTHRT